MLATSVDAKCVQERNFPTLNNKRNTMLEKDPWSSTPDGVFSASVDGDSIKEMTSLVSDNRTMSSHCFKSSNRDSISSEFCTEDSILSDRCTAVENNSYNYSLSQISQIDNDLSFFDKNREDEESSDLLYYGWPDIGNFEDVDRMFRSCDSSFGLGGSGNEDELGWFSSSDAIDGSEDAFKSALKLSCLESNALKNLSENQEPLKMKNGSSSVNDSTHPSMKSASVSYKANSQPSEDDETTTLGHLHVVNASNQISESEDEFMAKEQGVEFNGGVDFKISTIHTSKKDNGMINVHKKQQKHQNQSKGKRKDRCLENGGLCRQIGNLPNEYMHLPYGDTSRQVFTSLGIRQQKQTLGPDSFGYLETNIPYMHSNYCHPSEETTFSSTLTAIKSENTGLTSLSPKESSYASNQLQSREHSHDPSFVATAIKLVDKREKLHRRRGFQPTFTSNLEHMDLGVQASICDPVSVQKQVYQSGNEFENQSNVEGVSIGLPSELGSSNVQESSSMNSGLHEISLEATSFRQLQQVMEKLDIRTKLCIRDSLYRLARSAEQRHNYANLNGGTGDVRDTSGTLMVEGTNKFTGFMDMETDTNPIDRSIAHLLFHRPSDLVVMPSHNSMALNSHTMIQGSFTNSPMMADQLVCHEETVAETDRKVADH